MSDRLDTKRRTSAGMDARRVRGFAQDRRGSIGPMLAFLVAIVIFMASVGTVLLVTRQSSSRARAEPSQAAAMGVQAGALAGVLIDSPGFAVGGSDWASTPDSLQRLGLADSGNPGTLDYQKLDSLRRAGLDANATDGYVNYPEAVASLGLPAGAGFHIRTWPNLAQARDTIDSGSPFNASLRMAYMAHMQGFLSQYNLGTGTYTIRMCLYVLDLSGTPVNLAALDPLALVRIQPGGTPDEPGFGAAHHLPMVNITAATPLNADLDGNGVNDAVCINFQGLSVDSVGYTYGQASLLGSVLAWNPFTYNDYVSGTFAATNFYPFSGEMFDGNPNDNAARNTNADGHMVLTAGKPIRQMVVRLQPLGGLCGAGCGGGGAQDPGLAMTPPPTCTSSLVNGVKTYTIGTTVRNDGNSTTQFWGNIQVHSSGGASLVAQNTNTFLVPPGATTALQATIPANTALCPAGALVSIAVYDPNQKLLYANSTLSGTTVASGGSTPPYSMWADTYAAGYSLTGASPKITFAVPGASGGNRANTVAVQLWDSTMTVLLYQDLAAATGVKNGNAITYTKLPANLAAAGYVVRVVSYNAVVTNVIAEARENLLMVNSPPPAFVPVVPAPPPGAYPYLASDAAALEVGMLQSMFQGFCPYYDDSTTASPMASPPAYQPRCDRLVGPALGSVYPDVQNTLNNDLPNMLATEPDPDHAGALRPKYLDVLVVGSDVDQTAMSKPAAQLAVKNWTMAGGHLVVFGSTVQDVNWLQPLFQSGIASSSEGISTPDLDSPLLHTPYDLDVDHFAMPDSAWVLDTGALTHFTNVVVDGSGHQILTLSDPADFGFGRIALSAWKPAVLAQANADQARHLIANLVFLGYQDLYLDYGPQLPADTSVVPYERTAVVHDPRLGDVTLTVAVYVYNT